MRHIVTWVGNAMFAWINREPMALWLIIMLIFIGGVALGIVFAVAWLVESLLK